MTQKETMEQMLTDVLNQFGSNPKKHRCVRDDGRCLYNPPLKSESIGCAIGMYLSTKKAKEFDKANMYLEDIYNLKKFPKWMLKLPLDFLASIQNLHDYNENWNNNGKGLTNHGCQVVKNIISAFNLDFKHKYYKPII